MIDWAKSAKTLAIINRRFRNANWRLAVMLQRDDALIGQGKDLEEEIAYLQERLDIIVAEIKRREARR